MMCGPCYTDEVQAFTAAVRAHPHAMALSYSPGGGNSVSAGRWVAGQSPSPRAHNTHFGPTGPSTAPLGTMYRIVTDFHGGWYGWGGLQQSLMIQGNFSAAGLGGANNTWPDPDMIPIGHGFWGRSQEQDDRGQTIMTAFILSRAPLMAAGKFPLDDKSLSYLANREALRIHAQAVPYLGTATSPLPTYLGNCTCVGGASGCTIPRNFFPAQPCVQIWASHLPPHTPHPTHTPHTPHPTQNTSVAPTLAIGIINLGENVTSVSGVALRAALDGAGVRVGGGRWLDVWSGQVLSSSTSFTLRPHASVLLEMMG